jgi:DNA-3-methyladenine glycosylase I
VTDGLRLGADGVIRCWWAGDGATYGRYHDTEWGVPIADERVLFELLCLEGFQAGLSWITILRKRDAFRSAFDGFDPVVVAGFGPNEVGRLMADAGIVRNRAKIEAAIGNARAAIAMAPGELAAMVWEADPAPEDRPAVLDADAVRSLVTSPGAIALSKALKRRGWRFVGPTTVYAFLQSAGVVNDHVEGCPRQEACEAARAAFTRPSAHQEPV